MRQEFFSHSSSEKLMGWGSCLKIANRTQLTLCTYAPDNWILLRGVILYAGPSYIQVTMVLPEQGSKMYCSSNQWWS